MCYRWQEGNQRGMGILHPERIQASPQRKGEKKAGI